MLVMHIFKGFFHKYNVQNNCFYLLFYCNIIDVFTVTFNLFNASLWEKSIKKKNLTDPNF